MRIAKAPRNEILVHQWHHAPHSSDQLNPWQQNGAGDASRTYPYNARSAEMTVQHFGQEAP